MKKKIGSILFFLSIINSSYAQIFQLGPRIALSSSRIKLDTNFPEYYNPKFSFGAQIGVVGRMQLPIVYIQPELLLTTSGIKYTNSDTDYSLRYSKLELPIMVGTTVMGIGRIQLGPIISLLINARENSVNVSKDYERLTVGLQAGIGVDIYKFILDLKYETNLSPIGKKLYGIPTDYRQHLLILSIGMNLIE